MTTYANDITRREQVRAGEGSDAEGHREELREHAGAIKEDVKALKDDATAAVGAAGTCLREEAERVNELAKSGGESVRDMHTAVCRTVSKHPTAAVLTTLGVGVLLGRLIGGR